jgi:hypothetical protein
MQKALEFLERVGASQAGHASGSLMDHLVGTWRLLQAWGCSDPVCFAGLFHSVYGTSYYKLQSVPFGQRRQVRELVGDEAEQLAFLFCVADRPGALWAALDTRLITDRLTGAAHELSPHQTLALIEIECANCIDQGLGLSFLQEVRAACWAGRLALRDPIATAVARSLNA